MSTPVSVLLVGSTGGALEPRLARWGVSAARVAAPEQLDQAPPSPSLVVVSAPLEEASRWVKAVRAHQKLSKLPVLAATERLDPGLEALDVDAVAVGELQLERQVTASLRARQAIVEQERHEHRMEVFFRFKEALPQAATEREQLVLAARAAGEATGLSASALHLPDGSSPVLIDESRAVTPIDLAGAPLWQRALDSGRVSEGEGSIVFPVSVGEHALGALVLQGAPDSRERALLGRLADAVMLQASLTRAHATLQKERGELESAYLDRYRELTVANKRLEALDKWKDEMLAMVSHDARAPLQVLLGHGRLLLEDELPDEVHASVDAMVRMGKKILEIMESVLEQARTTRGAMQLLPRPLDLARLCHDAAKDLAILAEQRGARLEVDAPGPMMVDGEEVKLRQVLQNLVVNALEHGQSTQRVTLRCGPISTAEGPRVKVCVEDDGGGFTAGQMTDLFDRYEREGIGHGLAICRDLVRLHGGEIWAEQRDPGAVLAFSLPLRAPEKPKAKGREAKLLLVDDDANIRRSFARILGRHWKVETAADGVEGVEKAKELKPDLVLVDLFMPRQDGLDTIKKLRQRAETAAIPIILMSARAEANDRTQGQELDGVELVPKLTAPEELIAKVRALLKKTARAAAPAPAGEEKAGLLDQPGITARLEEERARAIRYGRPLCVAVLRTSQEVGERASKLARAAREQLRAPDLLGHLGNGVLVLVLPETSLEPARALANRLCELLEAQGVGYSARVEQLHLEQGAAESLELLLS